MPLPKNRSRKKTSRKTPKGAKIIYFRGKKAKTHCAACKVVLAGVTAGSKTEKTVSRKFGGNLCHSCSEFVIKESVRVRENAKSMEDVDFLYRKYVQQLVK